MALRAKREREWEEEGGDEWEMYHEEGEEKEGSREAAGGRGMGDDECQMGVQTTEGDGGSVEGSDVRLHEGEAVGEASPVKVIQPERKPLKGGRGTRRAKAKEEAKRLAQSMSSWLLKPTQEKAIIWPKN